MTDELNQWVDAIARLTALTQEGGLKWEVRSPVPDSDVIGPSYYADHKGRRLRLERRRVREDGYSRVLEKRVFLDFVDDQDTTLWTFPYLDALDDLYAAVQYQTAGVQHFLDDLLGSK